MNYKEKKHKALTWFGIMAAVPGLLRICALFKIRIPVNFRA